MSRDPHETARDVLIRWADDTQEDCLRPDVAADQIIRILGAAGYELVEQANLAAVEARIAELQERAAQQGSRIFRLITAMRLAAAWGIRTQGYHGEIAVMLRDWVKRREFDPLPWPSSPTVDTWLRQRGFVPVDDGRIGFKAVEEETGMRRDTP